MPPHAALLVLLSAVLNLLPTTAALTMQNDNTMPALQSALLTCCPESPVWLRWRGFHGEARLVERRLSMPESNEHQASMQQLLPSDAEAQQPAVSLQADFATFCDVSVILVSTDCLLHVDQRAFADQIPICADSSRTLTAPLGLSCCRPAAATPTWCCLRSACRSRSRLAGTRACLPAANLRVCFMNLYLLLLERHLVST